MRSKAYRWGEDGIAGVCDHFQLLCFAPAFWNGRDPILKERLFGLTAHEGNHGEDVKEAYFHLDNTPSHSYMKYLYKYPQAEYPYAQLVEENRREGRGFEFELLDTGVFHEDRYFDLFIEYAKADPEDLCIRIEAFNRGPDAAPLHLLPHLWFRNTWAWGPDGWELGAVYEPVIRSGPAGPGFQSLVTSSVGLRLTTIAASYFLGRRFLYAPSGGQACFTFNETNGSRVFGPGAGSRRPYVKDAFHRHVVHGDDCLNPERLGTKACLHFAYEAVPPGGSVVLRLRLTPHHHDDPLADVDAVVDSAKRRPTPFTTPFIRKTPTRTNAGFSGRRWRVCSGPSRRISMT